jgi:uncharacterized protein YjbJ (UPF0337 family)
MNQDRIEGQWKQLAGKIKEKWGRLTDDDLKRAEGNSEYLAGRIQERYGIARDAAEKQVKEFQKNLHKVRGVEQGLAMEGHCLAMIDTHVPSSPAVKSIDRSQCGQPDAHASGRRFFFRHRRSWGSNNRRGIDP